MCTRSIGLFLFNNNIEVIFFFSHEQHLSLVSYTLFSLFFPSSDAHQKSHKIFNKQGQYK